MGTEFMESVTEIPWGLTDITLKRPLTVEYIESTKGVDSYAPDLQIAGNGADPFEALQDLAGQIEATLDALVQVEARVLVKAPHEKELLEKLDSYLPDVCFEE